MAFVCSCRLGLFRERITAGYVTVGFVVASVDERGASVRLNLNRQVRTGPTLVRAARLLGSSSSLLYPVRSFLHCNSMCMVYRVEAGAQRGDDMYRHG